jgi:hypothetical protein
MKKGLGSIPKGLAWINSKKTSKKNELKKNHDIEPATPMKTSQKGLNVGWTRATFIIKQDQCDKLKALAYWDRRTVKEIMEEALHIYLKNKRIKAMPEKK